MPAILRASFIAVLLVTAAVVWQGPTATEANGVAAISAGGFHTCALTASGGVKCWGSNQFGQLGDGKACGGICSTPVNVTGLTSGVAAVSAGELHTCALTTASGVKCWGYNGWGQLGNGTNSGPETCDLDPCSSTPLDVTDLTSGVAAISASAAHTCALTTGGGVKCWGINYFGQLGDGTTADSSTPVDVSGLTSGVIAVSAGGYHTCALITGGAAQCWGVNEFGQLGNGTTTGPETCAIYGCSTTPVDVTALTSGVAAISAGGIHSCALTTTGGVKCWGSNQFGELGDSQTCGIYICATAVDVTGLSSAVTVSVGFHHTCSLTMAGDAKCWGRSDYGQLGDGTTTGPEVCGGPPCSTTPIDVTDLTSSVAAISAGTYHTCALTTGGGLKCWGWNGFGQLGNGTTMESANPVNVFGLGSAPDADDDGCPDIREQVTGFGAQNSGGNRNPKSPYDYFNPTHDGENRIDDIIAVVDQYFVDSGNPAYNPDTDRTLVGPNLWNSGPPNGFQRVDDILNAVYQYFHDCA